MLVVQLVFDLLLSISSIYYHTSSAILSSHSTPSPPEHAVIHSTMALTSEVDTASCMHCRARSSSSSVLSADNALSNKRLFSSSSLPSLAASDSSQESEGYFSFQSIGLREPGDQVEPSYRHLNTSDTSNKVCIAPYAVYVVACLETDDLPLQACRSPSRRYSACIQQTAR